MKKLPNSCKFKKNNCSAVLASENLEYHEEDCKFRSMLCPFGYCKEIIPAIKLDEHLKSEHGGKEQNFLPQKWEKNNVKISAKIDVNEVNFDQDGLWCGGIKSQKNLFLLNAKMNSSRKHLRDIKVISTIGNTKGRVMLDLGEVEEEGFEKLCEKTTFAYGFWCDLLSVQGCWVLIQRQNSQR